MLACENSGKRLAADTLDDERHQEVAGVRVREGVARNVVEAALARDDGERILARGALGERAAAEQQQLDVAPEAAGMVHELAKRHGVGVGRQLGHVAAHAVVEGQPAVAGEQQQCEGGELLGRRGDVEHGVGVDAHAPLDVGEAIAGGMHELAAANDANGAARLHAALEPFKHGVGAGAALLHVPGKLRCDLRVECRRGRRWRQ